MMKITLKNGVTIEVSEGDEIPASVMQTILGMPVTVATGTVTTDLGDATMAAMTAPVLPVAPEIVGDEIDDEADEEDAMPLYLKPSRHRRNHTRNWTLNPPVPSGRWPSTIYLSKEMAETFTLLRAYPEGLTSEEIGIGLGLNQMIASGRVNRLRDVTPLVELIGKKYRMSMIGADLSLRIEVARYPSAKNKKAGWQKFVARPLPDGTGKTARR